MTTVISYLLLPPNWKGGVRYRRAWRTSIQKSVTGRERRSALFTWPRKGLDYTVNPKTSAEMNYIKRKMFKYIHEVWGIPIWPDLTLLTAAGSIGDATLSVNSTADKHFENGGTVILINLDSPDTYEIITISSFTNTQITIAEAGGLLNNWLIANTEIYPLLKARIQSGQRLSALTDAIGEIRLDVTETFEAVTTTTSSTTTTTTTS